jgi:hypothetical protein
MAQCTTKKTKEGTPCQIPAREGQKNCHIHRRQRMWRWILSRLGIAGMLGFLTTKRRCAYLWDAFYY